MNQKNIFSAIAVILLLQGIVFLFTGAQMASDTFPSAGAAGQEAVNKVIQVIAMLSITVGLIAWASRTLPQIIWAFTIGFLLIAMITFKHMFVDHINVPVYAAIIQTGIALICAYLWWQNNKAAA